MQQEWYVSDFVLWSKNWSADHLSPLPINQSDFRKVDQVYWEILPFCCWNIFSFYGWSSPKRYPTPWKSDRILIPTIFFGINPVCWAASPTHDYSLFQSYQIPFFELIEFIRIPIFWKVQSHFFLQKIGSKSHPVGSLTSHLSWTPALDTELWSNARATWASAHRRIPVQRWCRITWERRGPGAAIVRMGMVKGDK